MLDFIFSNLELIDDFIWAYLALPLLMIVGLYITFKSRFLQVRQFPAICALFMKMIKNKDKNKHGVHPLQVFFTSIGGCVGIGNVVVVCTAVQVGGPGAVFWIWVGGFLGMMIKYSEVFLGMKYRRKNRHRGYDGGPMFFLRKAYKVKWVAVLVSLLLCIYGTEILMFRVMTDAVVVNWHVSRPLAVAVFLFLVLFAGLGGIKRIGKLCSTMIPLFMLLFVGMGCWVIFKNIEVIPSVIADIFSSAFSGSSATGAFAGSTMVLAAKQGVERGSYSGDIGIGYASIIHSESSVKRPETQASLAILGIFLDTFVICTMSLALILVTGVWSQGIPAEMFVQEALGQVFPHMEIFMPFFLILLGYSTLIAFFFVGLKCAKFLSPKKGVKFYYAYAIAILIIFSLPSVDMSHALTTMQVAGGVLLVLNVVGIFLLRKELSFAPLEKDL